MLKSCEKSELFLHVETLLKSRGVALLELHQKRRTKGLTLSLVVFKENHLTADFLEELEGYLRPHLEAHLPDRFLLIELASPGLNRVLRSREELPFFYDRRVEIVTTEGLRLQGILQDCDGNSLLLNSTQGVQRLLYQTISEARVKDY